VNKDPQMLAVELRYLIGMAYKPKTSEVLPTSEVFGFKAQSPLAFRFTSERNLSIRFLILPRQSSLPTGPMAQL
jgi:hypothetical protein